MNDPFYMSELMIVMQGPHQREELRNDTDTDGHTKRLKPRTIKRFSEDVSFLIFGIDEFKPIPLSPPLSHE